MARCSASFVAFIRIGRAESRFGITFLDRQILLICAPWRLSAFFSFLPSCSCERARAAESEPRENGGTERPIKLTNANTSRLGSGVGAGQRDAQPSIRFDLDGVGRTDAAGPDRNRQ